MPGNAADHLEEPRHPSLPTQVIVLLGSLVLSAVITTFAIVVADRIDQPALVVVDTSMPTIAAQIDGAVATPGVYALPGGARLDNLVGEAGGLAKDADVSDVNLAARVGDGERIVIPRLPDGTPAPTPAGTAVPLRVNVNSASVAELDQLPGIGPVLGERIVAYRELNGPFTSLDEVANVEGISTRLLNELRPFITLDE